MKCAIKFHDVIFRDKCTSPILNSIKLIHFTIAILTLFCCTDFSFWILARITVVYVPKLTPAIVLNRR